MGLKPGIRKKNLFRIPDQGVKKAPDPDPQHCYYFFTRNYLFCLEFFKIL
jgi:hypothetical protein